MVKLTELKAEDIVEVIGFKCMSGQRRVLENAGGLFVICLQGRHYLSGQALTADDDTLVGVRVVSNPEAQP